ncbi:TetR/AcrR family transcriptional regulator [Nocardioides sp. 616]|uniref:TetR/AcrR family transcriptional regulator n=1 Tax=Nocardioides sp. 616 TaxID=2268090 RepID=UPI000CE51F87|nr:TetR/AcrR family transcriptional regulator [Nocardioides sp. 616]
MSTTGSERADVRRNRQLILDAAAEAVLNNPQASISDVAERAGLTRATVYRHYEDRDALLRALVAETASHVVPLLLAELRPLAWGDALDLLAQRAITMGVAYRDAILTIAPRLEEAVRTAVEGEPIQAEIAERRAAGEIVTALPDDWLALCIRTLCLAAIGRLADPDVDRADLVQHLSTALRGLTA